MQMFAPPPRYGESFPTSVQLLKVQNCAPSPQAKLSLIIELKTVQPPTPPPSALPPLSSKKQLLTTQDAAPQPELEMRLQLFNAHCTAPLPEFIPSEQLLRFAKNTPPPLPAELFVKTQLSNVPPDAPPPFCGASSP